MFAIYCSFSKEWRRWWYLVRGQEIREVTSKTKWTKLDCTCAYKMLIQAFLYHSLCVLKLPQAIDGLHSPLTCLPSLFPSIHLLADTLSASLSWPVSNYSLCKHEAHTHFISFTPAANDFWCHNHKTISHCLSFVTRLCTQLPLWSCCCFYSCTLTRILDCFLPQGTGMTGTQYRKEQWNGSRVSQ